VIPVALRREVESVRFFRRVAPPLRFHARSHDAVVHWRGEKRVPPSGGSSRRLRRHPFLVLRQSLLLEPSSTVVALNRPVQLPVGAPDDGTVRVVKLLRHEVKAAVFVSAEGTSPHELDAV
jgi:hypothetical protein